MPRRAFALLEVIISLAILVVALAALGELLRNGLRSATQARDLSRATMLAETKLAQITSGLVPPDPVSSTAFENEPGWLYSVEILEAGTSQLPTELLAVQVSVIRDVPEKQQTVSCSLVRWISDPAAQTTAMDSLDDSSTSNSSSSSTGSSAASGTGGSP